MAAIKGLASQQGLTFKFQRVRGSVCLKVLLLLALGYALLVTSRLQFGKRVSGKLKTVPQTPRNQNDTIHLFTSVVGQLPVIRLNNLLKSLLIHRGQIAAPLTTCCSKLIQQGPSDLEHNCTDKELQPARHRQPIHLHVLTDVATVEYWRGLEDSLVHQDAVVNWTQYNYDEYLPLLEGLKTYHHSGKPGMAKLLIPAIIPETVQKIISIDSDALLNADISELWGHFDKFNSKQALGIAAEQVSGTDVKGNSGLLLMDLKRLRNMNWISIMLHQAHNMQKVHGHLATSDQVVFTAMLNSYPHIAYRVPCEWNVQLYHSSQPKVCPVIWPSYYITFPEKATVYRADRCNFANKVAKYIHFDSVPKPGLKAALKPLDLTLSRTDSTLSVEELRERFNGVYQALFRIPRSTFKL